MGFAEGLYYGVKSGESINKGIRDRDEYENYTSKKNALGLKALQDAADDDAAQRAIAKRLREQLAPVQPAPDPNVTTANGQPVTPGQPPQVAVAPQAPAPVQPGLAPAPQAPGPQMPAPQAQGLPGPGQAQTAPAQKPAVLNHYDQQRALLQAQLEQALIGPKPNFQEAGAARQGLRELGYAQKGEEKFGAKFDGMSDKELDQFFAAQRKDDSHPYNALRTVEAAPAGKGKKGAPQEPGTVEKFWSWLDGQQPIPMTRKEMRDAYIHNGMASDPEFRDMALQKADDFIKQHRKDNDAAVKARVEQVDKLSTADTGARNAATNEKNAATDAVYKNSIARHNDAETTSLNDQRDRRAEAAKLQQDFDALTPEQQAGAEGNAIRTKFNMLNIKNGAQLGLASNRMGGGAGSLLKRAVDLHKNDDGTYTATDKATGQILYNAYNGMPLPVGTTVTEYDKIREAAAKANVKLHVVENNGEPAFGFEGPSGEVMQTMEEARASKPKAAPGAGAKPTATTQGVAANGNRMPPVHNSRSAAHQPQPATPTVSKERIYGMAPARSQPRGQ
jgi:hypothetical protein